MSDTNKFFSYTNRNYENARQEGISKIPQYSNYTWTDLNGSDPGIIIIDYLHALVDMIQYYQDHNALEVFLSTAKERKNIFRLAKQLGYEIRSSKGAIVDVTFTTDKSYATSYVIPKYTKVSTQTYPVINYLTSRDVIVTAGETSVTIPCIQGTMGELTYVGTGKSSLDNVTNPQDQFIELSAKGVDIDSITVTELVSNEGTGDPSQIHWTPVDYIVFSKENEKAFEVRLEHNGNVKIYFGNGQRGYCPKITDTLKISYIYNLGSKGKIAANQISSVTLNGEIRTYDGVEVRGITVKNEKASIGGADPESSEEIVANAPSVIKTHDRAVTLEDFEVLAKRVSGVKEAKAYDIKNAPEFIKQTYIVKVMITPEYGEEVTDILKKEVLQYLEARSIPPLVIDVIGPNYVDIDIKASIVIEDTYYPEDIEYQVNNVISNYFEILAGRSDSTIVPNELIVMINSTVPGIRYIESLEPSEIIKLPNRSLARVGSVDLKVRRVSE